MELPVVFHPSYLNANAESVIWVNFDGREATKLPSYDDVAIALLKFDKVFVEYRSIENLSEWLDQDSYLLELLRCDHVGLVTSAYSDGGMMRVFQEEWDGRHHKILHDVLRDKARKNLMVHQTALSELEDEEEKTLIRELEHKYYTDPDSYEHLSSVSEKYMNLRIAMTRGLTVRAHEQFQQDYAFMSPKRDFIEFMPEQKAQKETARFFGIPHPLRPYPDRVFEFRQSAAFVEYRDFVGRITDRLEKNSNAQFTQGLVIDEIISRFEADMRRNGKRNLLEAIVFSGVDLVTGGIAGTAASIGLSSLKVRTGPRPQMSFSSLFRKWDK